MARITVEDCLEHVDNRFALVMLAVKRAKQLYAGADPLIECENREIITALREIAAGSITAVDSIAAIESKEPARLVTVTLKDPDDI